MILLFRVNKKKIKQVAFGTYYHCHLFASCKKSVELCNKFQ